MTTKTDLSKPALLNRLDARIHDLEMANLKGEIEAPEYQSIKANLLRQVEAIEALA